MRRKTKRFTRDDLRAIANDEGVMRRNGVALKIWQDGTITRIDVRLDLARKMTVTEAFNALGYKYKV